MKLEDKSKEELIADIKERRKWDKINAWTRLIGSSILLIILIVGFWLKLR